MGCGTWRGESLDERQVSDGRDWENRPLASPCGRGDVAPARLADPVPGLLHHQPSQNGGTEAINGIIELHRRIARGFRNLDNYRLRMILAAGRYSPKSPMSPKTPRRPRRGDRARRRRGRPRPGRDRRPARLVARRPSAARCGAGVSGTDRGSGWPGSRRAGSCRGRRCRGRSGAGRSSGRSRRRARARPARTAAVRAG